MRKLWIKERLAYLDYLLRALSTTHNCKPMTFKQYLEELELEEGE